MMMSHFFHYSIQPQFKSKCQFQAFNYFNKLTKVILLQQVELIKTIIIK